MESGAGGHVILVVDDVSVDRKLAARCLEREGHKYCLAYDGMQALQMLRSQAIDLVRGGACDTARGELLPVERGACFFFRLVLHTLYLSLCLWRAVPLRPHVPGGRASALCLCNGVLWRGGVVGSLHPSRSRCSLTSTCPS